MFVFSANLRTAEQQAQAFLRAASKIGNILSSYPGSLVVRIYKDGKTRITHGQKKSRPDAG